MKRIRDIISRISHPPFVYKGSVLHFQRQVPAFFEAFR